MKRTIIALSLALACTGAFATNNKPTNECGNRGNNCNVPVGGAGGNSSSAALGVGVGIAGAQSASHSSSRANSDSTSRSNAAATGGSAIGTGIGGQASAAGGFSSASNGNQTMTVNNVNPDDVKIRNVPNVNPWAAAPTATCVVTTGGAVAVPGFGGGLSTGTIDRGCEARENFRALAGAGLMLEAVRVLCRQNADVAKEVKECGDIHEEFVKRDNDRARSVTPVNQFNMAN